MNPDRPVAERLLQGMRALAAEPAGPLLTPDEMDELCHEAIRLQGCLGWNEDGNLARRRTRWKWLLRRALYAAAGGYRRALSPRRHGHPELAQELRELGIEGVRLSAGGIGVDSSVGLAEEIVPGSPRGLGLSLVLGNAPGLAVALSRLGQRRVFLAPWSDDGLDARKPEVERWGPDVTATEAMDPLEELPPWLAGRFDTVVVCPPLGAFAAQRAILSALRALDSTPGRRLFWTGHPGRHLAYFGIYSTLSRHGMFLDRLTHDAATVPLDHEFAEQLLRDLLETPEAADIVDPEALEALFAAEREYEHLHRFRPVEDIVLRGRRLDLLPLQERDIPLFDAWLDPEFSRDIGFDEDRTRPTPAALRPEAWYPDHEWWIARHKDGRGVGLVHLLLAEYWTKRSLPFDVGIAEMGFRGQGLLNEIVQLGFHRVFRQLGAAALWANVSVSNIAICRGYRSNFFQSVRRSFTPGKREEQEFIRIRAEEYLARLLGGDITVPVDSPD